MHQPFQSSEFFTMNVITPLTATVESQMSLGETSCCAIWLAGKSTITLQPKMESSRRFATSAQRFTDSIATIRSFQVP